jgi:biotin carboxyl carrier protein
MIKKLNKHTKSNHPEDHTKSVDLDCGNKKVRCKTLVIHGEKYRTTYTKKFENRKNWEKPDVKKVLSYIPGTVTKLFVEDGKTVKKGEKMMVLEAMKMQNTINYPISGEIKNVNVKVGDRIPKNFVLVEYK